MIRASRIALIALDTFLALSAIGGGVALVVGFQTPPISLLDGSPFRDYLFPGLALIFMVGGSATFAAAALIRGLGLAPIANLVAAVAVIIFEVVEITVIGSPAGPARNMQIFYISLGLGIIAIVLFRRSASRPAREAE